jgi:hypothetical protein
VARNRTANWSFISTLDEVIKAEQSVRLSRHSTSVPPGRQKLTVFRPSVPLKQLCRLTRLLDRHLYPRLRTVYDPVPIGTITNMCENYSEQLPKTMRFRAADLSTKTGETRRVADFLGITQLLKSEQLQLLGERVTGKRLATDPSRQVICYEAGDFSGPHNDHHPEESHLRKGYVDIHIGLHPVPKTPS